MNKEQTKGYQHEKTTMRNVKVTGQAYISSDRTRKRTRLHKDANCTHLHPDGIVSVSVLSDPHQNAETFFDPIEGIKCVTAGWCKTCEGYEKPELSWREQGRCFGAEGWKMWQDYKQGDVTAAIICASCPVRSECAKERKGLQPGMVYAGYHQGRGGGWKRVAFSREEWAGLEWWVFENGRLPVFEGEWKESTP